MKISFVRFAAVCVGTIQSSEIQYFSRVFRVKQLLQGGEIHTTVYDHAQVWKNIYEIMLFGEINT